jgi:zinc protease
MDSSTLFLTTTRGNTTAAFDLLADSVMHPAFKTDDIERIRKQRLGQLLQLKEDPSQIADLVTALVLNGKDHPYAYTSLGTTASVTNITMEDLQSFWKSQATPGNAAMVVSGDFTKNELKALLEKSFGSWETADTPAIRVSEAPSQKRVVLVDVPGAQQTQIRVSIPGAKRSTSDYETLQVMNQILGGTSSSRISFNLRERNGYTYGAGSSIVALKHGGWIVGASGVRTDVTDKALNEMVKEMFRMETAPITEEEMNIAKSSLVGSLPGSFETTAGTVRMYYDILIYNLPLDYYSQFPKKVEPLTAADAQQVAKKYLTPEKMLAVAVGDRKVIERGIRSLGLGPLEVRDAQGDLK